MKKRKLMSNEELKQFYYAVLRVAAFERRLLEILNNF